MTNRIPPDAFEYYVSLGPDRSYQTVATKYGVSKRAVAKRASNEAWSNRLERIEHEARERADEKLVEHMEDMRVRHMKTLKAMNARALAALQQYPLSSGMDAMRAAEMTIKLERLVAGEPTDRTAVSVEEAIRREYERWMEPEEDQDAHARDDE